MHPEIKLGIYRHYKGALYQLLHIARDANADQLFTKSDFTVDYGMHGEPDPMGERLVVVYIALELNGAHLGPRVNVRSVSDEDLDSWNDLVCCVPACEQYGKVVVPVGHKQLHRRTGVNAVLGYAEQFNTHVVKHQDTTRRFRFLGPELTQEMIDGPATGVVYPA